MTTLAVDYGEKRVGLAITDGDNRRPKRLKTLINGPELLDDIAAVVERQEVATIVVGLPRNLDGDDTAQTAVCREFSQRLAGHLPRVEVELQDEAGTSSAARERLEREGLTGDELKRWLDAEAAAIILEDYLGDS